MTDPDEHHSSRGNTPPQLLPQPIQQPNFGAILAAAIPQVQISDNLDAPPKFVMLVVPPLPAGRGTVLYTSPYVLVDSAQTAQTPCGVHADSTWTVYFLFDL